MLHGAQASWAEGPWMLIPGPVALQVIIDGVSYMESIGKRVTWHAGELP